MKKQFLIVVMLLCSHFFAVTHAKNSTKQPIVDGHPAWIMQGNVYEVNIRQYTPEGTINAFAKHLDRLKAMGVQTLWFMPINPISLVERKGSLGSYYAVSDYTAFNPEFGTMADWKRTVNEIHKRGMKVIIDWVPNHTGCDHRWLKEQPDFFEKDSTGKAKMAQDWADTRQLNYKNPVLQDSMTQAMKFWITHTDIDGLRCDVAWNVPGYFWSKCIPQLKAAKKDIFMLAEADTSYLPKSGFDAVYPWRVFHKMAMVASGKTNALAIDSAIAQVKQYYPANTIQLYFTSNHDENSWNKADYEMYPGEVHAPFAVFTQTMMNSVPLIYSGQEEPLLRPLKFFDKDPIVFGNYQRASFYKTLLNLRKRNVALSANASFRKVSVGDDKAVYAYVREKAGKQILVVLNFSSKPQSISISDKGLIGLARNVFSGKKEVITSRSTLMQPWAYLVYEY